MIIQQFISIQIKVLEELLEVGRLQFSVAVLSLELSELCCINVARVVPINPFEGSVGLKVSHGCQNLSESLNSDLLLRMVNKDLLHFQLAFVSEHSPDQRQTLRGPRFFLIIKMSNV